MKNILKIFRADMKGMLTNFFVLVIAGGLCLIPALYAWFNIFSNWDPYGNTSNIAIAVVNLDEGWTDESGEELNMGDDIIESLKQKTTIGWVFLDEKDDAVHGVTTGDYYAAIVIDENFTYSMYKGMMENIDDPKITYYVNDKKNAVATKITDTAVGSVQASINKSYIDAVTERIFEKTNIMSQDIEDADIVNKFIYKMTGVRDTLDDYDAMIATFIEANGAMQNATSEAGELLLESQNLIESGQMDLTDAQKDVDATADSFMDFSAEVSKSLATIETSIESISQEIEDAQFDQDVSTLTEDANNIMADATSLSDGLEDLSAALSKIQKDNNLQGTINTINDIKALSDAISNDKMLTDTSEQAERAILNAQKTLNNYSRTVKQIESMYNNQIAPQVGDILDNMSGALVSVSNLLTTLGSTAAGMSDVFVGVEGTMDALNMSLEQLQDLICATSDKLTGILNEVEKANSRDAMDIILNLLAGNPEKLGNYFSEPVKVEENYIYAISNYGSGVAPFYTTLAIWVGMTILVSLLKVHASKEGLDNPKPHELFFGRYLMFLLLSLIQSTIIVLGDLCWLKIQCLHPFEFWLAAAVTSLTFSLIVYSLTIAFGDIGKAIAVVIMVIQIAGSGGTYPIEALPGFFQAVYIFLPFPYAINAMRECIGGMYQNTFSICIAQLGLFCIGALLIGLVVRIPFMGLNHFFEERMEDTKMM